MRLTIAAEPERKYELQASPDLTTWQPLATITNTTPIVDFIDTPPGSLSQRFYRSVLLGN